MKSLKRITIMCVAIIFLIALLPVSAFADVVATEETYATGCMPVFQIFGQSHNVEYIFDAETTQENINMLIDLWNQYTTADPTAPTLGSMYNQIISEGTYEVTSYNSMQYLAFNISALLNQKLCAFFDWVLSGPAEMTKVDDQYYEWSLNQNNTVDPISVFAVSSIGGYTLYHEIHGSYNRNVALAYTSGGYCLWVSAKDNSNRTIYYPYWLSVDSSSSAIWVLNDNVTLNLSLSSYSIGSYYAYSGSKNIPYNGSIVEPCEVSQSEFTTLLQNINSISSSDLFIRPYLDDTEITLPDPSEVSQPVRLVSNSQLPSYQGDTNTGITTAQTVDDLASSVIDDVMAGDTGILDTNVTPETGTEVYIPLLPVTLPSFNFSFSGIWHYVVTWVGSLGSWLTLMFSVWSALPYAIVVPVYATAVIVIVIGTLKRFL